MGRDRHGLGPARPLGVLADEPNDDGTVRAGHHRRRQRHHGHHDLGGGPARTLRDRYRPDTVHGLRAATLAPAGDDEDQTEWNDRKQSTT